MPRTIYSSRLWSMPATSASGSYFSSSVPNGFIWDVRDIVALNSQSGPGELASPLTIAITGNLVIFKTPSRATVSGELYHLELRQVMNLGEVLQASSNEAGWSWSVTGYQLTE